MAYAGPGAFRLEHAYPRVLSLESLFSYPLALMSTMLDCIF